ncbi:MAG: response regulator transcription factor [Chthoniobacteraceae bacterium]
MSHPRSVGVLVVDGEPLTQAGIVACIRQWKGYRVCGLAKDPPTARQLCAELRPDLIIVDLPLPADGFGLVREFARLHRAARVVVISTRSDRETVECALRAGARGYVRRSDELKALRAACAAVLDGKLHVSPEVEQTLLSGLAHPPHPDGTGDEGRLSERERTVFRLIGRGLGATAIARELSVSVKTVETHQRRIREKLDVGSAGELRKRAALTLVGGEGRAKGTRNRTEVNFGGPRL